jgi:hypothetical protein
MQSTRQTPERIALITPFDLKALIFRQIPENKKIAILGV